MKNSIVMLLALLTLVFCFTGCDTNRYDEYTSLIFDSANDGYSVRSEVDLGTRCFEKENMPDKTCVVLGKNYTGSYYESRIYNLDSYTTDLYRDESGIEFGFRSDTGELVYINFMNNEFFDTQPYLPDVSDPQQTAVSIATEVAGEYICVSDYVRIDDEDPQTRYKEKDGQTYEITYYFTTFAKKIKGYLSSDYIDIKVTSKGTIASIFMGDINAFENAEFDIDEAHLNQSVSKKVEDVYKNKNIQVERSEVDDQKLAITPEGDIAIYTSIDVYGTDGDKEVQTAIHILTFMGRTDKK